MSVQPCPTQMSATRLMAAPARSNVVTAQFRVIMLRPQTALHFHVERWDSVHQLYTDVFPPRQGCVCVCVCVRHPCYKGLSNPRVNCRGRGGRILAMPTKLRMLTGWVHRRVNLYLRRVAHGSLSGSLRTQIHLDSKQHHVSKLIQMR